MTAYRRTAMGHFKRADTGALVSLTPQGLNASVREFSLQIQASAIPCGSFLASQTGGGLPESPMIGVDNPTFHEGLGGAVLNNIDCGGGGTNPPDPEPEEPVFLTYYHHRDHLGSDRVVTDESGAAVSFHNYYPFGQEMAGGGMMGRFKFTGHERDEETGLDYMKARFFNGPSFLSVDPLGASAVLSAPQTWNRYSYVSGDPIAKNDPLGLVGNPQTKNTYYDPEHTKWLAVPPPDAAPKKATQLTPEPDLDSDSVLAEAEKDKNSGVAASGDYASESQAAIESALNGDWKGAFKHLGNSWKAALTDPEWLAQAFVATAGSAVAAAEAAPAMSRAPVATARTAPGFVATEAGEMIVIPSGAMGPTPTRASGVQFLEGSGGPGLNSRVTGVRIMDANARQGPRVVYMNATGQTVSPTTGRTVVPSDPAAHIPLKAR